MPIRPEHTWTRKALGIPLPRRGRDHAITYRITEQGCWECTSHCLRGDQSYPTISVRGKACSLAKVIYEAVWGLVNPGEVVRHTCDNRLCINPHHLIPGTPADNSRDMVERGRSTFGARNGNGRLSEEQVREIKESQGMTAEAVAAHYGVDRATISSIWRGATWRHVVVDKPHVNRTGNRKLTPEQVREVREHPEVTSVEFGRRFGVTHSTIGSIRNGRNWKDDDADPA